jgi:hypothetical protein
MLTVEITDGKEPLFSFMGKGNIVHTEHTTRVQCKIDHQEMQKPFPKDVQKYIKKLLIDQKPYITLEQNALRLLYRQLSAQIHATYASQCTIPFIFQVLNSFHPTALFLNGSVVGTLEKGIWQSSTGALEMHFNLKSEGKLEIGLL